MATATDSIPDVATSVTPDLRRASTAPTEESASGVGLTDQPGRQSYQQPEDEEEEDEEAPPEEPPAPPVHEDLPATHSAEDLSPTADYLMGIMAEFRKLEGKLSTLLTEHAKVKDENDELRNQPPAPDPSVVQELETLTTKYNKVKKLYFQKETQLEEINKENDALKAEVEDYLKELDVTRAENNELTRDLNILDKEREAITTELQDATRERDSLARQRETIKRERDEIAQERDDLLNERDTIKKIKEAAIHEKQEAIIDRDEARQDKEALQNRIKDLEDEVAKLQAHSSTNGVRDKRQSATLGGHGSTGSDYPHEILKLKYDKVKRLYYEQQKTIAHLEDRLRMAESPKGKQTDS
ncbi:hypothetical protein ABW19_dt0208054 [Dactylella cylindrospora]|nr:hypothetical protein ABW19_dt0208054 [Dactylella cylindrospora]